MNEELETLKGIIENKVLEERGTILVWMSAGNSYFKEEIITDILRFTGQNFLKTIVMAPDEPAEHTFKALGCEGNKAKKKARLNANLLQNRARRIIASFPNENRFKLVEWMDEVINNSHYQHALQQIMTLYNSNVKFMADAQSTTKDVLESKTTVNITQEAILEAVNYLLKELAFVVASPKIYNVVKVTYLYHKQWDIYEKFICGTYDGVVRQDLGFLLYKSTVKV